MKNLRVLGAAMIAGALALTAQPVLAQSGGKPAITSLDQALKAVREERRAVSAQNQEREKRFIAQRNEQQAELNRIRAEVKAAEAESGRLEKQRSDNERDLNDLKAQLADRQGEFGELFGAARAAAADLKEQLGESLVSAQYRGRGEPLGKIAQSQTLPTIEQLEGLWFTMLQEASEQAKVVKFESGVIGTDNKPEQRTVTRIGPFVAFSDGDYLTYGNNTLKFLARQPGGAANSAASDVENFSGEGFVRGVIDPSLGTLLGLSVETPTFRERVDQGGGIGYAIIVVALFGIIVAIYKWVTLSITAAKVQAQMKSDTASDGNPLGRVMQAYESNRGADIETLQLKLDDAVLKELPRLESGLTIVKVLAAVAPLMGLLGTVIGMIVTFQAITLFGTGDPKLMAGGISQALVTTVQGLVAAIPLLLLHTFAASAQRRVAQVLEEQSAGMVAEYAERGR
ncbi:MotA/TolQ/ExbB proton channel family protein [Flagellatimonas centrodinii]|uniref:MotA/TolQ/ExbB proton channel family protein n=1 Tax=Flagellatimonas centrodinii TaxID=2806210 RepID=UPI001FEEDE44|nr:MotA/TolQ/ExbB proton channel family protein [Flagellatimonas centrodinii]ULQ47058.1 MotA/TolQ/ExbB proton channel family protein [Flagellatimonas centrodinii]